MDNVNENEFRVALSRFATGVTVVTSLDVDGELAGITVNAFASLSLDPPLVISCFNLNSNSYAAIRKHKRYCIHVLSHNQGDIAAAFARSSTNKSKVCEWKITEDGFPVLSRYHALFQCELEAEYPGGDHAILVGRIKRISVSEDSLEPLLYYGGKIQPPVLRDERRFAPVTRAVGAVVA